MLGLVAKNAILLVDRANHNRAAGQPLAAALLEAGTTRLRPILMTTLAMVCGMLPIALSGAPGAELKTGLGWTLIGGLSSSMVLTLVVVPVVYEVFAKLQQRLAGRPRPAGPALGSVSTAAAILGLLLFATTTHAQVPTLPAPAEVRLSLADAVARLRTESPELAVARLDVAQAEAGRQLAARARWPTINGFGQYQHNFKPPVLFFPSVAVDPASGELRFGNDNFQTIEAAPRHVYNAGVNVALPLFQRELGLRQQLAGTAHTLSGQRLRTATVQQVAAVQRLYLQVLLTQGQGRLAALTLANARRHLLEARGLHRAQLALDSDTLRAFVAVANARAPLVRLERTARTLTTDLATRLALPPGAAVVLTDSLTAQPSAAPLAENALVEQALARRPELQQIDLQAAMQHQQVAIARARALPSLAFYGQYSTTSQASDFTLRGLNWPQTTYAGVQLSVPIFNATTQLYVEQAHLQELQTAQQRRALTTLVAGEVRLALQSLRTAQDQLALQALTVQAAARAYRLVHQRWYLGLTKYTDLADAEEQLNQARANRLQACYDYRTAEIDFQQATGVDS